MLKTLPKEKPKSKKNFAFAQEFSRRLSTALLHSGLTAAELSRRAQINEGQLSLATRGKKALGREAAARAAKATGVDEAWLYLGTGSPPALPEGNSLREEPATLRPSVAIDYEEAYFRLMQTIPLPELAEHIQKLMSGIESGPDSDREKVATHIRRLLSIANTRIVSLTKP